MGKHDKKSGKGYVGRTAHTTAVSTSSTGSPSVYTLAKH